MNNHWMPTSDFLNLIQTDNQSIYTISMDYPLQYSIRGHLSIPLILILFGIREIQLFR
jgi:hypothetical protein